ncbi:MAG: DUF370 domain-containing protein [Desulfitobacteriaceae bacterium]|nr:DUF370 domain-containing protein [Desulfitobacteriaceae bacterium]MDD4751872.1 DUF370 domain-containing protein [Desulfitobacteriaceae bacterium]
MYLHIGDDRMVDLNEIILILDYKKLKKANQLSKYMEIFNNEVGKKVITDDECKSVIITKKNKIFSPISPMTLIKRVNAFSRLKP